MFEGEKTIVFWIGMILLGLASLGLFGILWMLAIWNGYGDRFNMLKYQVPPLIGGIVFILIGLYMMKSGVKERPVTEMIYCSYCGTRNIKDAVYCKKCGKKIS